ncbi:hypothetical protein O3M35_010640 [Rhynocoris fuscipes]|uniref:RNase H type-1 domain-containing protein n=1 Tax=Rhynocoris fuscipes TaxID=488301 RepID=A0AAW1D0N3_9HEMI
MQATDNRINGSKINNTCGVAFYDPQTNYSGMYKVNSLASIFTCEATAILQALAYIDLRNLVDATIFSDSLGTLEKLCHFQTGSNHIVMAIIDRWVALRHKGVKVEMVWVRAHAGIECNSRVDWFAKKATQLGEPLEVKIPYSDVIGTYKQKAIANWQKIYL